MGHRPTDTHTHAQRYKTHRDNLKASLLGSWLAISLSHTHTLKHTGMHIHACKQEQTVIHTKAWSSGVRPALCKLRHFLQLATFDGSMIPLPLTSTPQRKQDERERQESLTNKNRKAHRHDEVKKDNFQASSYIPRCLWLKGAVSNSFA